MQDFSGTASCLAGSSIVAATPRIVLVPTVSTALVCMVLRLIGHAVLSLAHRGLLVLARRLRDVIRGWRSLICRVLLGRVVLVRIIVWVVVVRSHGFEARGPEALPKPLYG